MIKKPTICKCGCGNYTTGFPRYKNRAIFYPEYIRGHHPNCKATQTGNVPAWNKGLTKENPSVAKICFQVGHKSFNDWSKINNRLKTDPEFKKKWLQSKKGHSAWNKGLTRDNYPNGIVSGKAHGNWRSNARGIRDLSEYKIMRIEILKRDNYTCQNCNHRGGKLHVHHIVSFAEDETLALSPDNLITLCVNCHKDIHFPNRNKSSGNS